MTIREFIAANAITMEADWADENPNMDGMPDGSSHWKCTFTRGGITFETFFSMGPAHSHEPEAREVLDCLASDASSVENTPDWLDWAEEFGYSDADALRKARSTHETITEQSSKLKAFLGDDAYETLLWKTERD